MSPIFRAFTFMHLSPSQLRATRYILDLDPLLVETVLKTDAFISNAPELCPVDVILSIQIHPSEELTVYSCETQGGEPSSIWSGYHNKKQSLSTALNCLVRMLTESIRTDITINASNGSIGAHRAVLATRSPVFRSMFSHNLQEMELSTVNISDMSFEACQAFLNYIYGNCQADEFLFHRLALLRAADKYDISDLKEACHDSLLEDIDAKNVLERLQMAHLYRLPRLKTGCLRYLVNFGKICEINDDFNLFLKSADRELIAEIFHEILANGKGIY